MRRSGRPERTRSPLLIDRSLLWQGSRGASRILPPSRSSSNTQLSHPLARSFKLALESRASACFAKLIGFGLGAIYRFRRVWTPAIIGAARNADPTALISKEFLFACNSKKEKPGPESEANASQSTFLRKIFTLTSGIHLLTSRQ